MGFKPVCRSEKIMGGFEKNVHGSEFSPIYVSPTQNDKKSREEASTLPSDTLFFAAWLLHLSRFIAFFTPKTKSLITQLDQKTLIDHLIDFKNLIQMLENEDQSHNSEYILRLSKAWHQLLEDCDQIADFEKKNPVASTQIKLFIIKILSFPKNVEHSLGYYLTEYAGRGWLPFPFMDLLHLLFLEHQKRPASSQLANWASLLSKIILSLERP
jgi:hypothetical protein